MGMRMRTTTRSLLIKSMRAVIRMPLYWLAKMIHAGEDPRFIARRISSMRQRTWDWQTRWRWCLPMRHFMQRNSSDGRRRASLSLCLRYTSRAPTKATAWSKPSILRLEMCSGKILPVPVHLKDSHYSGAKQLGHGDGYKYSHDFCHFVPQDYSGLISVSTYRPSGVWKRKLRRERLLASILPKSIEANHSHNPRNELSGRLPVHRMPADQAGTSRAVALGRTRHDAGRAR